ncbi:MAG: hypothetical protein NVS2B4_10170 [Ramlibacter sp.]
MTPEVIGTRGMMVLPNAAMTRGAHMGTDEASTMVNGQPNAPRTILRRPSATPSDAWTAN